MIIAEKINRVASGGLGKNIKFKMEANSTGFNILIKNIYTNQITAIVRELGTNALESHIKAGTDRPFKVELPTHDKPNFVIRDYGTGLTPDDIENIYSVMFCSDKRDSNEVNGCFGIGSKCPYAYTDNYTLESFVEGKKYIYACFLDEAGMPNISPIAGTEDGIPTSENNGVRITIPVMTKDIYEFTRAAKTVYSYFRNKPEINTDIPKVEYKDFPFDWKIRENSLGGAKVVMGDIAYDIANQDKLQSFSTILGQPVDIFCNIGDVSIDSGRERVVFDNRTLAFLKDRLTKIDGDVKSYLSSEIAKIETEWELRIKAAELSDTFLARYTNSVIWNGKHYPLSSLGHAYRPKLVEGEDLYEFKSDGGKRRKGTGYRTDFAIPLTMKTLIVHLDKCAGPHLRCSHHAATNDIYVYGISCTRERFEAIVKEADFPASIVAKASDLFKPKVVRTPTTVKYEKVMKYLGGSWDTLYQYWRDVDNFDIEEGGVYIVLDRGSVLHNGDRLHPNSLKPMLDAYKAIYGTKPTIYGITKSLKEDFENHDDWSCFTDKLAEAIPKKYAEVSSEKDEAHSIIKNDNVRLIDTIEEAMPKHELVILYNSLRKNKDIEYALSTTAHNLKINLKKADNPKLVAEVKKFNDLKKSILTKYPLIPFLSSGYNQGAEFKKALTHYLSLKDA